MTRERALELACAVRIWGAQEQIADAILAAVAEEREACAKIADLYSKELAMEPDGTRAADEIADKIRERAAKDKAYSR